MKGNKFKCEICEEIFKKEWSDADAEAEMRENGFIKNECSIVCDDCYNKIFPILQIK